MCVRSLMELRSNHSLGSFFKAWLGEKVLTAGMVEGAHDCVSLCECGLSGHDTSRQRGSRIIFSCSQMCVREDHAHALLRLWHEVGYIAQWQKLIRACLYPLRISGSMAQIFPGGNHLPKSK